MTNSTAAALLLLLAAAAPVRAEYQEIAKFENGATADVDERSPNRLLFKTAEGRLARGVVLPGKASATAADARFLAVAYLSSGRPRLRVLKADGRVLADAPLTDDSEQLAIRSDDEKIVVTRGKRVLVFGKDGSERS